MWKLNNALQNDQRIKEEIKREIRKHTEMNENKDTTYQNLWDTAKAMLKGTFTANAYINCLYEKRRKISNQQPNLPP